MIRAWRWARILAATGAMLAAAPARSDGTASFGDYASRGYAEVAAYARNQAGNPTLAEYFAERSREAADGAALEPIEVSSWHLPAATAREATTARRRLIALLDAGARERDPYRAAVAIVNFDCWLPQFRARSRGLPGSADCRRRFYVSLGLLQREMRPSATTVARAQRGPAPPVIQVPPAATALASGRRDPRNVIDERLAAGFGSCQPGNSADPCRSTKARPDRQPVVCGASGCGPAALDTTVSALEGGGAGASGALASASSAAAAAAAATASGPGSAGAPASAGAASSGAAGGNGSSGGDPAGGGGSANAAKHGDPSGNKGGPKGNGGGNGNGNGGGNGNANGNGNGNGGGNDNGNGGGNGNGNGGGNGNGNGGGNGNGNGGGNGSGNGNGHGHD
jgi:hypothetical protein